MKDWRALKTGDRIHLHAEDFDGITDSDGVVSEAAEDHAVMTEPDGTRNWIDDDTAYLFSRVSAV